MAALLGHWITSLCVDADFVDARMFVLPDLQCVCVPISLAYVFVEMMVSVDVNVDCLRSHFGSRHLVGSPCVCSWFLIAASPYISSEVAKVTGREAGSASDGGVLRNLENGQPLHGGGLCCDACLRTV